MSERILVISAPPILGFQPHAVGRPLYAVTSIENSTFCRHQDKQKECTILIRGEDNININFSGRIPGWRNPGKERFFFSGPQKSYARPFSTLNTGISERKLLVVPRLAFQKVYAKRYYVVFFGPYLSPDPIETLITIGDTISTYCLDTPEPPRRHPVGHSLGHPLFLGTILGTLWARETPAAGRGVRNLCFGDLCSVIITSGFSKPRFWGTYVLHPGFSWFSSFPCFL